MNLFKITIIVVFIFWGGVGAAQNPYLLFRDLETQMIGLDMNVGDDLQKLEKTRSELGKIFLKFNDFNNDFTEKVMVQIQRDEVLSGLQLTILHRALKTYLNLSAKIQTLASQTGIHSKKELKKFLDSGDVKKNLLALSWTDLQLDNISNFVGTYGNFLRVKKLRILLNAEDRSYSIKANELKDFTSLLISNGSEKNLRTSFRKLEDMRGEIQVRVKQTLSRPVADLVVGKGLKKLRKELRKNYRKDRWFKTGRFLLHHASGLFGNAAGAIKFRRGLLDKNETLNNEITSELKPLDMITEKTPFILTDKFIPGNFGHNAIWLGTKGQLIDLKMWDHPSIKPLQPMIESGFNIIETDRSGTHLKSIEKFMNVDDFAIMRLEGVTDFKEYYREVYAVAIAQLGKTYDFNFDVETTDKLVCSELLYQAFGDIRWPTESYLGRTTISPDNVASLIMYQGAPMGLKYYIKGREDRSVSYKTEEDLARDLGFRLNMEFSTLDNPFYEQPYKKCVTVIKDENKRRVCHTAYRSYEYTAPGLSQSIP